jgi:hypothetical protein
MMGKFFDWLQERIKHWIKPATSVLLVGILSDLKRSRTDLMVENAMLRQQLIVLKRQIKRPQHQGVGQRIPEQYDLKRSKPTRGQVRSKAILGGLHHSYSRATYLN